MWWRRRRRGEQPRSGPRVDEPRVRRFDQPIYYWTNFPPRELVLSLRSRIERGDPDALKVPLEALDSDDIDWVHRAVLVLGALGDARAVEPLIATVDRHATAVHGKYTMTQSTQQPCNPGDVVFSGVQALGELADARALPVLIGVLGKDDFVISAAAARALGALGDPRAVEPLVTRLERPLAVRRAATGDDRRTADIAARAILDALGRIGDTAAVEPLLRLLDSAEPQVIIWAADTLGTIGGVRAAEPLSKLLLGNDPRLDRGDPVTGQSARMAVATALGALGALGDGQPVEPLIAMLERPDDAEVHAAARALRGLREPRALEPLIAVLRGPHDTRTRCEAAAALGELGDRRAVEPLIDELAGAQSSDDAFPSVVIEALGTLGDPRAVEPLLHVLDRFSKTVMVALGALGDPRAVPPLVTYLNGGDRYERAHAADALGLIGGPEAGAALLESLRTEPRLRRSTVEALQNVLRNTDRRPNADVLRGIADLPDSLDVLPWGLGGHESTVALAALKELAAADRNTA